MTTLIPNHDPASLSTPYDVIRFDIFPVELRARDPGTQFTRCLTWATYGRRCQYVGDQLQRKGPSAGPLSDTTNNI